MRPRCAALLAVLFTACVSPDLTSPTGEDIAVRTNRASATTKGDVPVITSVVRAGGQATIAWTVIAGSAGYQVVSCGDVSLPTVRTSSAQEASWTYRGLEAGAGYGVKVRAWHADGAPNNGRFSDCVRFVGAEWVAAVTVQPATVELAPGATQALTAVLTDRWGNALVDRVVTWESANPAVATVTSDGRVTAVAPGTATITATSEGKSGSAVVTVQSPGWHLIARAGAVPAAITNSAYAPDLDAIFAAEMPDYGTGSLWRFDLATAQWSRVTTTNWPNGKFRKLIYDAARHRLITYWDGLGEVWEIPVAGGAWSREGSVGNSGAYYEAYAFLNPVTSQLMVFGGYGFGSFKNTLWAWNGANAWNAVATSGAVPEPRFGHWANVAIDAIRGRAFFTNRSLGGAAGNYDDLWSLDLRTYRFTNLLPPSTDASARLSAGMAYDAATNVLYRFGGASLYGSVPQNDFVFTVPEAGQAGWRSMPTSASTPSARYMPGLHFDALRRRLVLVSGFTGSAWASDVWEYALP